MANSISFTACVSEDKCQLQQIADSIAAIIIEQYEGCFLEIKSEPFWISEYGLNASAGFEDDKLEIDFGIENLSARIMIKDAEIEEGIPFGEKWERKVSGIFPFIQSEFPFGSRGFWFLAKSDTDSFRRFEVWVVDFSCQPIWKEFIHRENFLTNLYSKFCL